MRASSAASVQACLKIAKRLVTTIATPPSCVSARVRDRRGGVLDLSPLVSAGGASRSCARSAPRAQHLPSPRSAIQRESGTILWLGPVRGPQRSPALTFGSFRTRGQVVVRLAAEAQLVVEAREVQVGRRCKPTPKITISDRARPSTPVRTQPGTSIVQPAIATAASTISASAGTAR